MTHVHAAAYEYKIGTSSAGSASLLSSLGISWPRHDFSPYLERIPLGDGTEAGVGYATAKWTWDIIRKTEWDALKIFRTNVSTPIFIRTKNNYDVWTTYSGHMIWPQNEEWVVTRNLKFTLEFIGLVVEV